MELPRSVLLAAWWSARPVAPHAAPDTVDAWARRARNAVESDDEPHLVRALTGEERTLHEHLTALAAGPGGAAAVLPRPGHPGPVPAPAAGPAVAAGECVLLDLPDAARALVPQVTRFGSDLEPGHLVGWQEIAVPRWRTAFAAEIGSLADAERAVRTTLATVATALEALDVGRAGPDLAEALERLREPATSRGLPRTLDGRRVALLALGTRLLAIVDLAGRDDGAAVTTGRADRRRAALGELDLAARRAVAAACAS